MKNFVGQYSNYLQNVKLTAENTRLSYMRDLKKFSEYLNEIGIVRFEDVNNTNVMGFVFALQKENKTPATISRCVATLHSFFRFLLDEGVINSDPSEGVKAPKVVKKAPSFMSVSSVELLLNQPAGNSNKAIRDRAMLEVLYATGIRVSELVNLKIDGVDLKLNVIRNDEKAKARFIPIGSKASKALDKYITSARDNMLKCGDTDLLFVNCNGNDMSRQGFWKIIKSYAKKAGIDENITPHVLRNSFAVHLVQNGADLQFLQNMMGHSDSNSTQVYFKQDRQQLLEQYARTHPRY